MQTIFYESHQEYLGRLAWTDPFAETTPIWQRNANALKHQRRASDKMRYAWFTA